MSDYRIPELALFGVLVSTMMEGKEARIPGQLAVCPQGEE